MQRVILHDYPFSGNAHKVRLLRHQLVIPFERRIVDIPSRIGRSF